MKKLITAFLLIMILTGLIGCTTGDVDLNEVNDSLDKIEERLKAIETKETEDYSNEIEDINEELDLIIKSLEAMVLQEGNFDSDISELKDQVSSLVIIIEEIELEMDQNKNEGQESLNEAIEIINNNISLIEDNIDTLDERINNLLKLIDLLATSNTSEYILSDEEINLHMSNLSTNIDSIGTNLLSGFDLNSDYTNSCVDETNTYDVCFTSDNYPNIYTKHFYDGVEKIRDLNIVKLLVSESWNNIKGFSSIPKIVGQEITSDNSRFSLAGRNSTSAVFDLGVSGDASSIGGEFTMKLAIYKNIDTDIVTIELFYNIEANYSFLSVDFNSFRFKIDYNSLGEIENMLLYKSYVSGFTENITIYTPTEEGIDIHYMNDTVGYFNKEYFKYNNGSLIYVRYSDTTFLDSIFEYEEYDEQGLIWAYRDKGEGTDTSHFIPLNHFTNWTLMRYENQYISYRIDITLDDQSTIYHEDEVWYDSDDASIVRIDRFDVGLIAIEEENNYIYSNLENIFVFYGPGEIGTNYKGLILSMTVENSMEDMSQSIYSTSSYFSTFIYNGIEVFEDVNLNLDDFEFELQI
jgi:hypothetical protein